jgi:hypothetical protein
MRSVCFSQTGVIAHVTSSAVNYDKLKYEDENLF